MAADASWDCWPTTAHTWSPLAGGRGGRTRSSTSDGTTWTIRRESLATEGEDAMTTMRYRTIDSPVGLLTLAGVGSTPMHLRMVDQTHEPDRSGWEPADDDAAEAVEQAVGYRRRAHRVRPGSRTGRHRVPAPGVGGIAHHPVRGDPLVRADRRTDRLTGSLALRWGWRTGETDRHHRAPPPGNRLDGRNDRIWRRN